MTGIKVTQADREWFKIFVPFGGNAEGKLLGLQAVDAGEFDDDQRMINLARHRIEAQRPLLEALEVFITKDLSCITVGDLRKAEAAIKQAKGEGK